MKKTILVIVITFTTFLNAQNNFDFDEVFEIEGQKSELFSKAKMAISKVAVNSNEIIRNEDLDTGIILVKAKHLQSSMYFGAEYTYVFDYTLQIMVKDNKVRILITDVVNSDILTVTNGGKRMLNLEETQWNKGNRYSALAKKSFEPFMTELRNSFLGVIVAIKNDMKGSLKNNDW